MNGMRITGSRKTFDTCDGDVYPPKRTAATAGTSRLGRKMSNSVRMLVAVADVRTSFLDQNRSNGPAYGAGAFRLSRCRSKYTSAALNNIIHDE